MTERTIPARNGYPGLAGVRLDATRELVMVGEPEAALRVLRDEVKRRTEGR